MARLQAPRATTEPAVFIIITAVRQFLARALGDQLGVSPSSSLRGPQRQLLACPDLSSGLVGQGGSVDGLTK